MRVFLLLFSVALLWEAVAHAEAHHKGLLSSINLGIRYSSLLQNRGVIFYRDFQVDPVVALFFFDDKLEFLGDSIGFRDFIWGEKLRARTRIAAISDQPLFPAHKSLKDSSPQRKRSYEWNSRLEWFLPAYNGKYLAEVDLGYSKDIGQSHGNYFELSAKAKLFSFHTKALGAIEPNLFSTLGYGDGRHNLYFYGPGAGSAGFNSLAYGLWMNFPDNADRYFPIVQLSRFQVLGGENRAARYALGRSEGWLLSFIATFGVLE